MHVHVDRHQALAVVRPVGRFFGGAETLELEHKLGALVDSGVPRIVIDLGRTLHLNSIAIGVLVGAFVRAQQRHLEVRLCNVDQGVLHTLAVLKLATVMPVFASQEEAALARA